MAGEVYGPGLYGTNAYGNASYGGGAGAPPAAVPFGGRSSGAAAATGDLTGPHNPPGFRSATTQNEATTGNTSVTSTRPTVVDNDHLIAVIGTRDNQHPDPVQLPTGFSFIGSTKIADTFFGSYVWCSVYIKKITDAATEPSSYTWPLTGATFRWSTVMASFLNVSDVLPYEPGIVTATALGNPTIPSATVDYVQSLFLVASATFDAQGSSPTVTGMTALARANRAQLFDEVRAAPGATGSRTTSGYTTGTLATSAVGLILVSAETALISGSSVGSAEVTASFGNLSVTGLSGTSRGAASQSADVTVQYAFTGTASGAATVAGLFGFLLPLQGQLDGTSAANANLSFQLAISSTAVGVASVTADLHIIRGLIGQARGRATVIGNAAGPRALSGTAAGVAEQATILGLAYQLTAAGDGVATVTADLTRLELMAGDVDGFAQVITGYLSLTVPLAGRSDGVASQTTAITGIVTRLAATTNGVSTVNASLTAAWALAGGSHGVATAPAAFTAYALFTTGPIHGVAVVDPVDLAVRTVLQTAVHGVSTVLGTLSGTKILLAGRSDGVATVVNSMGGVVELLAVAVNGVATVHADLVGVKPANDNFANATLLQGAGATIDISTVGATLETGEPDAAGRTDTVWYHMVVTGEGTLTLDTSSTSPAWASVIDVFTGTALSNLVLVGSEPVTYQGVAEPGDVWIRVSSTSDSRSDGVLVWSFDQYAPEPPSPYFTVDPVDLDYTPTTVSVTLANLTPDETVSFEIDNSLLLPDTITVDSAANAGPTALHIPALPDGVHTLTAVTSIGRVDVSLTVTSGGADVPEPLPTPPSIVTTGAVVRWVFQDPTPGADPAQYVVPMNPNKMTSPFGERAVTSEGTTAIDGQTLMWEGIKQPTQWQFSGTILDQDHLDNLVTWSEKKNRFYIIDHFNRGWEVYPQKLDATPADGGTSINFPKKHIYTFTVIISRGPVAPQ